MTRSEPDTPRAGEASPRRSPRAILAAVGFSVFVAADDLTVVTTMLRPIIGDLGLVLPDGLDDAAWIVNAYLIAFVAVMPIAGRLSDVIGRRRTFLYAYVTFMIGTILIPLSTSLALFADSPFRWFLAGRVLTAIGGGAMVPVALAVVGDVYPIRRRARALGTLGAIETMGWVWGPLYGAMLVRFLDWRWQFWLNIPLAVAGLAVSWWALAEHDRPERGSRIDWLGAGLLTTALVSLNLALLGSAEIQGVSGLDELRGGSGTDLRWFYPVAAVAAAVFIVQQRRSADPLVDRALFGGKNLRIALIVNFVVGAALIIAMVDVPLFINSVESSIADAAVVSGWVLSALTAAMALASYLGGRLTERTWYRPPVLAGLAASTAAFAWMGTTWDADTPYAIFALQLGLLGAGFGLTIAPTTAAVVDAAPDDQRGAAAAIVMVVRLLGLSVGLSALTAWGLARFNALRPTIELPPINDPDFQSALFEAQSTLTAQAIAETFVASAVVVAAGLAFAIAMRRHIADKGSTMSTEHQPQHGDDVDTDDVDTVSHEARPDSGGGIVQLQRRMTWVLAALGILVLAAFALIAVLFSQLSTAQDELADTRSQLSVAQDDMNRVEAGSALFASQVTGFQEQLVALEPEVSAGVDAAIEGLEAFGSTTLDFNVSIDETIPIKTDFVIDREIVVPIKTSIPINESFDTTIVVDTPLGFSVPLDVTVPVDIEVPVDLELTIPVNETIAIDQNFPVELDVPITVNIAETELAAMINSLAEGLESFRDALGGFTG